MTTIRRAALVAAGACLAAACGRDAPKPVPLQALPADAAAAAPMAASTASPTPAGPPSVQPTGPPSLPPGHPALDAPAPPFQMAVPAHGAGAGGAAVVWTVPEGWIVEPPASAMRKAQYRVPGPGGDAECLVFYFGPGQGGDPLSNAKRWASQFHLADGRDGESAMKTSETTAGGMKVLMVEVAGTYVGGMGGSAPAEKAGHMLLGAIVQGPDANWFFKLTGPEKTVSDQRPRFEALVKSLKKGA